MRHFGLDQAFRIVVALITAGFPLFHISQHSQTAGNEHSPVRHFVASPGTGQGNDGHLSECPICQFLMGGVGYLVARKNCFTGHLIDEVCLPETVNPGHCPFKVLQPRAPPLPIAPLI